MLVPVYCRGGLVLVLAPGRGPALLPCPAAGDEQSSERESSTELGVSWTWPASASVVVSLVAAGDGSVVSSFSSRTAMGLRRAWRSPELDCSSRGTVVTVGMWLFRPLSPVCSGVFEWEVVSSSRPKLLKSNSSKSITKCLNPLWRKHPYEVFNALFILWQRHSRKVELIK